MAHYTVDLHFPANGITSEVDEYIPRTFSEKFEAIDCYEYSQCDNECAGASLTVWSDDWADILGSRNWGTYSSDAFPDIDDTHFEVL